MRVLLTGAEGFLAWHIRCHLFAKGVTDVDLVSRSNWNLLPDLMQSADVVIHTAAINRGSDDEIRLGNKKITDDLVDALSGCKTGVNFIYCNSTQQHGDSVYSAAKRNSGAALSDAVKAVEGFFVDLDIPNVFGQHGKPDYNSFIATFVRNAWQGITPERISDAQVALIHVQDVAAEIYKHVVEVSDQTYKLVTFETDLMKVDAVWEKIHSFHNEYKSGFVPLIENRFDLNLFNTLRAAQPEIGNPVQLEKFKDDRGSLQVVVKSEGSGQTFVSSSNPGIVRGEHFHLEKIERFSVIKGQAHISMRKMFTDDIVTYKVNGDEPMTVDMPTLWTHNIRNVGDSELITMFWTKQLFDEDNPDTFFEKVGD